MITAVYVPAGTSLDLFILTVIVSAVYVISHNTSLPDPVSLIEAITVALPILFVIDQVTIFSVAVRVGLFTVNTVPSIALATAFSVTRVVSVAVPESRTVV